jgi:hypothetical protein
MRSQISIGNCVVVVVMVLGAGCGDDGGQDPEPFAGSSGSMAGSQAGSGSGSSGAGGNTPGSGGAGQVGGSGGTGQTGGSGGAMAVDAVNHCSPGTVYYVGGDLPSFLSVESNCDERDINGDGEDDHINSIALPDPMRPGESYAFSVLWDTGWVGLELWGTDEDCGDARELLASGRIEQDEIGCFTMNPTMAHPRLLLVWADGGGAQDDLAICPMGSCEP